jgi:hypothetical protein
MRCELRGGYVVEVEVKPIPKKQVSQLGDSVRS